MTRKEAKQFATEDLDKFWGMFQGFSHSGITKAQYKRVLEEFFYRTMDACISGIGCRRVAMAYFRVWLEANHPKVSLQHVFDSVDRVHAYT